MSKEQILSSDGLPLEVSLKKAERKNKLKAVALFKAGNIKEARTAICNGGAHNIEGVYRWMYDNLDLFGSTDEEKDKAILAIRDGLVNHSLVADPEINLSATLVELTT